MVMKKLIENIKKFINKYKKQLKNIGIISLIVIVIISIFVLCFYYPFNAKNNNDSLEIWGTTENGEGTILFVYPYSQGTILIGDED